MAISSGGLFSEFGSARHAHHAVRREISGFKPRASEEQYVVDIAFVTGSNFGPDPMPMGVSAGPVGRSQRRFIIWHRLPEGLAEAPDVRAWFVSELVRTEELVREYLPTKSRAYPAGELADEVAALREHLSRSA